jgi:plasmid stability protein
MSKMIQLRNVPDALHRSLKARAAMAGCPTLVAFFATVWGF